MLPTWAWLLIGWALVIGLLIALGVWAHDFSDPDFDDDWP